MIKKIENEHLGRIKSEFTVTGVIQPEDVERLFRAVEYYQSIWTEIEALKVRMDNAEMRLGWHDDKFAGRNYDDD